VGDFVPHTDDELRAMLDFVGLSSLGQLFDCVPRALRLAAGLDLPDGLSEPDVLAEMARLAGRNTAAGADLVCFAGGGAYDHELPSATSQLTFRSEFVTAYTPYQPEVAQGVLQALFEYQTLVSRLTGLPVANASLYDGAAAALEGANLASDARPSGSAAGCTPTGGGCCGPLPPAPRMSWWTFLSALTVAPIGRSPRPWEMGSPARS
jgi:glycine dehydrogenase subunit 1